MFVGSAVPVISHLLSVHRAFLGGSLLCLQCLGFHTSSRSKKVKDGIAEILQKEKGIVELSEHSRKIYMCTRVRACVLVPAVDCFACVLVPAVCCAVSGICHRYRDKKTKDEKAEIKKIKQEEGIVELDDDEKAALIDLDAFTAQVG